jgi:hypothetical protein
MDGILFNGQPNPRLGLVGDQGLSNSPMDSATYAFVVGEVGRSGPNGIANLRSLWKVKKFM